MKLVFMGIYELIVLLVAVSYPLIMKIKYPDLTSWSDGYYLLGKKGWVFQTWLISTAFLAMPLWLEKTETTNHQWMAFLSCIALMGVAINPLFKSTQKYQHFICVGVAVILSFGWSISEGIWNLPLLSITMFVVIGIACNFNRDKILLYYDDFMFWLENGALFAILYPLIFM